MGLMKSGTVIRFLPVDGRDRKYCFGMETDGKRMPGKPRCIYIRSGYALNQGLCTNFT